MHPSPAATGSDEPPARPHDRPDLSIVVVTYNSPEWTQRCLAALPAGAGERTAEIVVVDNASALLDEAQLRAWAPAGTDVVRLEENIGFGRACNLAATRTTGRHVVLVNPDAVVEPGSLDALATFAEADPGRGIVGGRVTHPDGTLDRGSCWGRQTLWSLTCFATGLASAFPDSAVLNPEGLGAWERDTPREVGIVTGCLLLAPREVWDELGGFDPAIFMYGEDADLCTRAWRRGYHPSITPESRAVHVGGASSATRVEMQVMLYRGKASLVDKEWNGARRTLGATLLVAGVGLRALGERVTRRQGSSWSGLWSRREEWRGGW